MVLLHRVDPPCEAFNVESHFDNVLAPTLNQIDAAREWGIGELRWQWCLRDHKSSESKKPSQRTNDMCWQLRSGKETDVESQLEALTTFLAKIFGKLFDSFF